MRERLITLYLNSLFLWILYAFTQVPILSHIVRYRTRRAVILSVNHRAGNVQVLGQKEIWNRNSRFLRLTCLNNISWSSELFSGP